MENNIYTIVVTLISVLTGTTAWRYWEKRAMKKERDDDFIRVDCKERIAKLEALLVESSREKEEMRELILRLTKEVAELRVKVEFLTHENELLNTRTKKQIHG
jgi:hypothetical protein